MHVQKHEPSLLLASSGEVRFSHFALIMAALLCRRAAGARGTLVKFRPAATTPAAVRAYTSGLESAPSSVLQCQKGKDPPRVSPLELLYRLTIQGFYSRMHELQVGSTCWKVCIFTEFEKK